MTREAELELEIARLREALEFLNARIVTMDLGGVVERALSTPPSTTALQELIDKVERRTIERCAKELCRLDYWCLAHAIRALPTGNLNLDDLRG